MNRRQDRRRSPEPADDGPWIEPGEAAGLLLLAPADPAAADLLARLAPALATGAVAALVVDPSAAGWDAAALAAGRQVCHEHGAAFLLDGGARAARAGADGVLLRDVDEIAAARRLLGPERIIGAACGLSRHAGMVAGEAGADYVMFGAPGDPLEAGSELFDLVAWWSELFVLPCAAAGPLTPDLAAGLTRSGADLLAVDAGPIATAADPAGQVQALADAMRQARSGGPSPR